MGRQNKSTHKDEATSSNVRAEVEAVFQEYGITPSQSSVSSRLSLEDYRKLRDTAFRIVQGDLDLEEVFEISKSFAIELNEMVQQIISLRESAALRELQEDNQYYDAFPSKIVRDNMTKEKKI
jgi:hypothetical protein